MKIMRSGDGRVGFAELFYDLVFVFAITQVSHHLLANLTLEGAMQTGLLFLAIWWVWIYSTWTLNGLDPDLFAVRILLFTMMTGGLFLSMALPEAFGERGAVYGICFALMQAGRALFVVLTTADHPIIQRIYRRIGLWAAIAGIFWIWGGFAQPQDRMMIWLIAMGIEMLGPMSGFYIPGRGRSSTTTWTINGGHMAERCALFVIICLGEALLVSGATFAEMAWDATGIVTFLSAVFGAIALWWIYFHIGHKRGTHHIEHSDDPGALGRLAYSYLHIPIVAGVVLSAVASELAIAHPHHGAEWRDIAVSLGGTSLFLLGSGLFKWISAPYFPLSHLVGLGLCAALVWPLHGAALIWVNIAALCVLALVAVWEDVSLNRDSRKPARQA